MPGGLLQLTITGEQNKYLTGDPKMTYFKYGYCQYTNFAMESIEQVLDGTIDFGQRVSATLARNGDLVSGLTLEVVLPALPKIQDGQNQFLVNWVNAVGYYLIESISIEIGGTEIVRHSGEWLYVQHELLKTETQKHLSNTLVHNKPYFVFEESKEIKCYIPLSFWFTKEIGNALPLVSLQNHDVKVHVSFRDFTKCVIVEKLINYTPNNTTTEPVITTTSTPPTKVSIKSAKLYCDYIFLDKQERKWFAQTSHRYLVEQVQFNGIERVSSKDHKMSLQFNHPCKELVWYATRKHKTQENDWLNFGKTDNQMNQYGSKPENDILDTATLFLNGHERISPRDATYFRLVTTGQHHTGYPNNYIYCYPLSLFPEKLQPSGALNFSIIDNAFMSFTDNSGNSVEHDIHMYANYNILIVTQGMGGLAFSN